MTDKTNFKTESNKFLLQKVKPKKYLGQHFLNAPEIAEKIVNSLQLTDRYKKVLEIGPGMGVLTQFLIEKSNYTTYLCEIDDESVLYLKSNYPTIADRIIEEDFLKLNISKTVFSNDPFAIIGNFPYNISSQILFRVYENKHQVMEVVGMFQKEVAERIAAKPGKKTYGILSVLLQAYYHIEYLFTVDENVFIPPPKVKSGVIHLTRNATKTLDCDEKLFKSVVKIAFNQRRKTLRNALKSILPHELPDDISELLGLRAEQLTVNDFISLTKAIKQD